MTTKILILGLSGTGKTYLSNQIKSKLEALHWTVDHFNADIIRKANNDWDFSPAGRMRQAQRMRKLAHATSCDFCIIDMIAPLQKQREDINPDFIIWMDTTKSSQYPDTDAIFEPPKNYNFRAYKWLSDAELDGVVGTICDLAFDWKKPTVQMLGRWQPWHEGHKALFKRAIAKTGQVCIMVRVCQGWQGSNPFNSEEVCKNIYNDLSKEYRGRFIIIPVPNIVNITYGRKVGYTIEQEHFDESIEEISATKIRASLGYTC